MKVDFNENEVQVLVQFIDAAVKALGLQAAEAAVVITRKLSDAKAAEAALAPAPTPKKEK